MSYKTSGPVAGYFLASLEESAPSRGLYLTDQVFRMRVDWACEFLDLADETAGEATAMRIADVLLDLMTVDEAAAAEVRLMRADAERFLLASRPPGRLLTFQALRR